MESKYIVAAVAANEAVWLRNFIIELGFIPSAQDPVTIYCENTSDIANAKKPRTHSTAKHIKLRFHVIWQNVDEGEIKICKVDTELNVVDPLTKALHLEKHE